MRLDPKQLRAEAEAHHKRLQSPLWQAGDLTDEAVAGLTTGDVGQEAGQAPELAEPAVSRAARSEASQEPSTAREPPRPAHAPRHDPDLVLVLQSLDRTVRALITTTEQQRAGRAAPTEDAPGWLLAAAGDPRTYDAPNAARQSVCVRVQPATFTQLRQTQERLGLRTQAGAWELLLRLGLAAAERLPAR